MRAIAGVIDAMLESIDNDKESELAKACKCELITMVNRENGTSFTSWNDLAEYFARELAMKGGAQ
jgi:hypothetical protein